MTLTGDQYTIRAGSHEATVVAVGAGLRRYVHDGVDITVPYAADALPSLCSGATLVPWPNRIRDGHYRFDGEDYQLAITEPSRNTALHGLADWDRWDLVAVDPASVTLGLDIVPRPGYPFEVRVEVRYALPADRGLVVTTSAVNSGARRAPFGAGHHPYLSTRGHAFEDVALTLPASRRFVPDDRLLPIGIEDVADTAYDLRAGARLGRFDFDDAFAELTGDAAELQTPSGSTRVWWGAAYRYLQLFTTRDLDGAAAVTVEPMTCPPDAFNSGTGLIGLEPGDTWTGSFGITPL